MLWVYNAQIDVPTKPQPFRNWNIHQSKNILKFWNNVKYFSTWHSTLIENKYLNSQTYSKWIEFTDAFAQQVSAVHLKGSITDKSLVGGKVPKCITSTTSTTKDTIIIVYFIPIDKKNIAEYKVYVNPARWYAGLRYILPPLL